eukprot:TRINITY_DN42397_c0_g1_i1.p1 TRINITY_DN42397_c0_g1~~TRINITY_DN42397_c0_g1_i1.p1  ORF type:complete len:111 (-),score=16.77 TRINITY_DN42397_c0_g1_i1:96-428(-)
MCIRDSINAEYGGFVTSMHAWKCLDPPPSRARMVVDCRCRRRGSGLQQLERAFLAAVQANDTARHVEHRETPGLSLIHISEPTRLLSISYAVFCLKKKKHLNNITYPMHQ